MRALTQGDLFSSLAISDLAKRDLEQRMSESTRHYHTLHHLDLLWARHRQYGEAEGVTSGALDGLIALAIAYHDAVYVGGRANNEEASADLWLEVSATASSLSECDRKWVADTIRATANHVSAGKDVDCADPRAHARQWVIDLDLTPLGECPATFDHNMLLLGAEVPHLSEPQRHASLLAAIRHFASARQLYRCSTIAEAFEAAARSNFRRYVPCDNDAAPRPTDA